MLEMGIVEQSDNPRKPFTIIKSKDEIRTFAKHVWRDINLVNLEKYIEPTRNRAELILHKAANHKIDEIYLKK